LGKIAIVARAFVNPKLTARDGHDLMATANTYGTGLSTPLLDKLIPRVLGFVWLFLRKDLL
jgi:hypothetical protein